MVEDITLDFDHAWSKSDVVLHTLNSDGKELHANKVVLTIFSPYFDTLFSGIFAEKNVRSVNMNCDYSAMKEILRNIHQVGFNYQSNGHIQYDVKMLKELYSIGDYYNFPHIRKLCLDQMLERPSVEMAISVAVLGHRDVLMSILKRLSVAHVKKFLGSKEVEYLFNKNEVLSLYECIAGKSLFKSYAEDPPPKPLNLEEITVEIQNPRIDLTKPWKLSDVAISARNSMGRLLYTNQLAINVASTKFKNLLISLLHFEDNGRSFLSTTVDVEYVTMREILYVIHHCDNNCQGLRRTLHPAMLHSMYRVAAEDQLDIRMVRELCITKLLEQINVDSLEVLTDLHISLTNYMLPIWKWPEWISRKDGHFSYNYGDEVVAVTPPQTEPRYSNTLVLWMFNMLSST